MADFEYSINRRPLYIIGAKTGFFAGLFTFSSMFYYVLTKLGIIPEAVRYYHVLAFIAVVYALWLIYGIIKK